ncbi:MAG TPA: GNAT family N-acetyltransferase [Anaerolineales bacterium]|nr:GNAT family N-acetyltransferase [Anaerolineales bacterium]
MIEFFPYSPEHLPAVSQFIAELNRSPIHHIGYFGVSPAEIASQIEEFDPIPEDGCVLAMEKGKVVGFLGLDVDEEIKRGWFYGPFVQAPRWQAVAEQLVRRLIRNLPDAIRTLELFADVRNRNIAQLAERLGFEVRRTETIWRLAHAQTATTPALPLPPALFPRFADLHSLLYPKSTLPASEILQAVQSPDFSQNNALLAYWQDTLLQGFILLERELSESENPASTVSVLALGVNPATDGACAANLLASAAQWAFSQPGVTLLQAITDSRHMQANLLSGLFKDAGWSSAGQMVLYRFVFDD